jgi:hypothetical protein
MVVRKIIVLIASMLIAGQAGAKTMKWEGTVEIDISNMGSMYYPGSGVATINNSSGGAHLQTLRIAGGISGSNILPVTDPETTGTLKAIHITLTLGTGTITGISGAPPLGQNVLPTAGFTRMCLFVPDCAMNIGMANTDNGTRGGGIGGTITMGGYGSVRVSIQSAPWSIGTVTAINQTKDGGFVTHSRWGFVHGGASATDSSTAVTSGVIQFIHPQQGSTLGISGNTSEIALFNTLTLRFIPEPGLLLLLASGVVGLGLLGRSRTRR